MAKPTPPADETLEAWQERVRYTTGCALQSADLLHQTLREFRELDREFCAVAREEELGERYRALTKATKFDQLREVLYAQASWMVDTFGVVDGSAFSELTPMELVEIVHPDIRHEREVLDAVAAIFTTKEQNDVE